MRKNEILNRLNQNQFIESVKENAMISIIGIDGKIAYSSIPFSSFLGFTQEELLKKDISILNSHIGEEIIIANANQLKAYYFNKL